MNYLFLRDHLGELPLDFFLSGNTEGNIKMFLAHFDLLRKEGISPEQYLDFVKKNAWEDKLEAKKYRELALCYAKYQEIKLREGVLDFADFHYYALRILTERDYVRREISERYKYILVDEYQDTDPVQNKIVNLILNPEQNLTVVGDDDQCIYRFRGASVENILDFREKYPDFTVVSLTENYRNPQEILDKAYQSIQYNNPHRLEVKLEINKKLHAQKSDSNAISLEHFEHGNYELADIAERIQKLVDSGVEYKDIAVLGRKNAHLQAVQEVLQSFQIPCLYVGARGLFDVAEVADLLKVFLAVVHSERAGAIFNFLALPKWGIAMSEIYEIFRKNEKYNTNFFNLILKSENAKIAQAGAKLKEYMEYSRAHSADISAYYIFTDIGWKDEILARQNSIEGEVAIANVAKFLRLIEGFVRQNFDGSLLKYIEYFELLQEAGENPQTAESDIVSNAVTLTSVHRSKGLEWEYVFVPYLVQNDFPSKAQSARMPLPAGLATQIIEDEKLTHLSEERRLYYVALTRARRQLFLSYSDFYRELKTQKKPSIFLSESGFETVAPDKNNKKENPVLVQNMAENAEPKSLESEFTSNKFSFSSLVAYDMCPKKFYYIYVQKFPTEMGASQQYGTQIHNVLNDFMKLVQAESGMFAELSNLPTKEDLFKMWKEKFNYGGYLSREIAQKFFEKGKVALSWFYDDWVKNGQIVPRYLEKSFTFPLDNKLITGRFDRVDMLPDGTVEVVDYKTGKVKAQKDVDNDKQLSIYALACEASLGLKASKLTLVYPNDGERVTTTSDEKNIKKATDFISKNIEGIEKNDFTPKSSEFTCKGCDFCEICPHAYSKN